MMRSSVFVNASARQLHQLISQSQRQRGFKSCTSSINRCNRKSTISPPSLSHYHPPSPCIVTSDSLNIAYRQQSTTTTGGGGNDMNGESSPGDDIIDSAAATTQWKRNHYKKLEDKFSSSPPTTTEEGEEEDDDSSSTKTTPSSTRQQQQQQKSQPLAIDTYDDVQPMWKQMESRVTKRQSLTLGQRGGVSGRRNVRKSDEDLWLEAGVYDSDNKPKDD